MGRAKAENDQLRAECAQYALHAQQFSAASDAAKTMNSDLNSMAKQLEDKNLMLQASHEQHQLLTQQNSQLQASLQDHQSRVAVLEGSLQREQTKTSELSIEVQTLSGTIREMKNQLETLTTKNTVALPEKAGEALQTKERELQEARRDTQSWMQRGLKAIHINDELQAG